MSDKIEPIQLKSDLTLPWIVVGLLVIMLAVYIFLCHFLGAKLQIGVPENQRVIIRTVLYVAAITILPLTNLIRHISLRLNQTMPGDTLPKTRYLVSVIISMGMVETLAIFGFVMFILGDDFNTLYIFCGLSALGLFLYRPKLNEYREIVEQLTARSD